jgi:hemoglobin
MTVDRGGDLHYPGGKRDEGRPMTEGMSQPFPAAERPRVDEAMIERLVRRFYGRVRADARLGPIFAAALGEDWEPHLLKMMDFWSSVMLTTGRYSGQPMRVHMQLQGVVPADFDIWLGLFETTSREECGAAADAFLFKAQRVADSFMRAMFYNPAFDAPAPRSAGGA